MSGTVPASNSSASVRQHKTRCPLSAGLVIEKIDHPDGRPVGSHVLNTCLYLGFRAVLADLEEARIR
jgi:hypothetical protein